MIWNPNVPHKALIPLILVIGFFAWMGVSFMEPAPPNLITASGTIGSIDAYQRRGHLSKIYLYVTEIDQTFVYNTDFLPNIEALYGTARRNMPIKVTYSGTGDRELWGLELNGKKFLDPVEAHAYRKKHGYLYLAIAMAILSLSIYLIFVKSSYLKRILNDDRHPGLKK
ncbi:MAG: hypothetical protein J2P21_15550 [Chloracidobacterium sp.]|nr:hypothetical protein [Chloracidobacterium sp.]